MARLPSEQDLSEGGDRYYTREGHPSGRGRLARKVAALLPAPRPGARLMDVGPGYGDLLAAARDQGWGVAGIEPVPACAAYVREKHGLDLIPGRIEDVPLGEGSVDAIVFQDVLPTILDPVGVLRKAAAALSEGGWLLIRVKNAALHGPAMRLVLRLGLGSGVKAWLPILYVYSFHADTLRAVLARLGFTVVAAGNGPMVLEDAYGGRWAVALLKGVLFGLAEAVRVISGGRCLLGPSIYVLGRKQARSRPAADQRK
ncbi:MAG: class I SAM-dependent methyltransferase [Nitrospirae bacterium]|nr:class I SAM-dependent methyltransferase [Nitrospirota bacterium]